MIDTELQEVVELPPNLKLMVSTRPYLTQSKITEKQLEDAEMCVSGPGLILRLSDNQFVQ